MAAATQTALVLGAAMPLHGDVFFASVDSRGTPGALNSFVMRELGYSQADLPRAADLSKGFHVLRGAKQRPLVLVVTIDGGQTAATLERNLAVAIKALFADGVDEPMRLWLPLMGTGTGGLSTRASFDATMRALVATASTWIPTTSEIALSFDSAVGARQIARYRELVPEELRSTAVTVHLHGPNVGEAGRSEAAAADKADLLQAPILGASLPQRTLQNDLRILSDAPAREPTLGFENIAENLVRLVENITGADRIAARKTEAQEAAEARLTIGIYAPWGAGKSTLIDELRRRFRVRDYFTILLNPWKWNGKGDLHDYVRSCVLAQAKDHIGRYAWQLRLRGFLRRYKTLLPWVQWAVVIALVLLVFAPRLWTFISEHGSAVWTLVTQGAAKGGERWSAVLTELGLGAAAPLIISIAPWLWKKLGTSLTDRIERFFLGSPPAQAGADGLSVVYQDIAALIMQDRDDALVKPFIFFVDDLDRCAPERVTLVLESVHSLTTAGAIVFIACDQQYVVAAVNTNYDKIAKHLPEHASFGQKYLEKIMQISVRLPLLDGEAIAGLGLFAKGEAARPPEARRADAVDQDQQGKVDMPLRPATASQRVAPVAAVNQPKLSQIINDVLAVAIEALALNVRQIKSYINTTWLYLGIDGRASEPAARRCAAFVFADQFDPAWLDAFYYNREQSDTAIGRAEALAAMLTDMIGDDRADMLHLYQLLGRRPAPLTAADTRAADGGWSSVPPPAAAQR